MVLVLDRRKFRTWPIRSGFRLHQQPDMTALEGIGNGSSHLLLSRRCNPLIIDCQDVTPHLDDLVRVLLIPLFDHSIVVEFHNFQFILTFSINNAEAELTAFRDENVNKESSVTDALLLQDLGGLLRCCCDRAAIIEVGRKLNLHSIAGSVSLDLVCLLEPACAKHGHNGEPLHLWQDHTSLRQVLLTATGMGRAHATNERSGPFSACTTSHERTTLHSHWWQP
mmetsp:Transcript_6139/g.14673  ORF Transcript_6139/g.14673 Transcript_6139/m.14673 type:complete len:224 (-) Transcript_6139:45-716(-)